MKTLFWALWSIIIWTIGFVVMGTVFLTALICCIFVPFERIHRLFPAPVLAHLPYLTLSTMRITYDPDFDQKRVSVFTQNHISMMDGHLACAAIPGVFCGLENAAHFLIPMYGWLMKLGNGIPVPSRSTEGRTEILKEAFLDRASRKISILTFPEGHRTVDGQVRSYRRGAFFMAREAGLPVVPICVRGCYEVLRKGTWIVRPGNIEIFVGAQVETVGLSDHEIGVLTERYFQLTQDWLDGKELEPVVARIESAA